MIWRNNLSARVFAAVVIPALTVTSLLAGTFLTRYSAELEEGARNRTLAVARQLVPASEFALFTNSERSLQRLVDGARGADSQLRRVAILDQAGRPRALSGVPFTGALPAVSPDSERIQLTEASITVVVPVHFINVLGVDSADLWVEESAGGTGSAQRGYILAELSLTAVRAQWLSMLYVVLGTTLLGLLLVIWLTGYLSGAILRPLRHMIQVVERIGQGELRARVTPDPGGVLGSLEVGINAMVSRIESAQDELTQRIEQATEELRREKDALGYMARTDTLTGLKNRRAFDEEVQLEIQRAVRHGSVLTLIMVDIDHFKSINDQHGHQFGDLVLIHFARILSESIRAIDVPGRWGGEEFVILMPDTTPSDAFQVAERIRLGFANAPLSNAGLPCPATASFGVASLNMLEPTLDALLAQADAALYRAKGGGRNQVVISSHS